MRREFIFLLLAIISLSTMWSLMSNVFRIVFLDKMLLDTVIGAVGAGNFSYWQLGHSGPLLVELTSLSGDADLYVADNLRPSYEVDRHNFSSITCGIDIVNIPADFPRPIGIGVFGAWSHTVSAYSIHVYLDRSETNDLPIGEDSLRIDSAEPKQQKERPLKREKVEEKPRFMKLLNFLDMVFDTFVL